MQKYNKYIIEISFLKTKKTGVPVKLIKSPAGVQFQDKKS